MVVFFFLHPMFPCFKMRQKSNVFNALNKYWHVFK